MSAALIAQLLATFGPSAIQLIDTLIQKIEAKGDVSAAEWTTLSASVRTTAKDEMIKVLTGIGDNPTSSTGAPLVAATV